MTDAIELQSHVTDISAIVEDVFLTMLETKVSHIEQTAECRSHGLTAAVQFTGENRGSVLLQCSPEQAQFFTRCMMAGEEGPHDEEIVHDVLGEVANIVGGNVKSLLSPGGAMSTPIVVAGSDYTAHVCQRNSSQTLEFESEAGNFCVTLVRTAAHS